MKKLTFLIKESLVTVIFSSLFIISSANANAQSDQMQRALLNMQNQIQSLQDKLAESQGKIEELNHEKNLLTQENQKLKAQISQMGANQSQTEQSNDSANADSKTVTMKSGVGSSTATITPAKTNTLVTKTSLPAVPDDAKKLYQESYALLNKGELAKAENGFKSYTEKYSNNALTPNAWYWLGQIQYKQNKFDDARLSFLNTAKFKGSDKRADALYKLGVTSKALGDKEKAKKFFEVLIKTYPTASSAALAKKELGAL